MQCTIERNDLFRALQLVRGTVDSRVTMPILSHVLLAADSATLRLTATDLETTVQLMVPGGSLDHGQMALPLHKLTEAVRELPPGPITIAHTETTRATITAGRTRYQLAGLPPEDFPSAELLHEGIQIEISAAALGAMLKQTNYAISTDESRPALNGILMEVSLESLTLLATDGHRLALSTRSIAAGTLTSGIIPRKAAVQISRILKDDEPVSVALSTNRLALSQSGVVLATRLIEGSFPDYRQVIPREHPITVVVPHDPLIDALRRVAVIANGRQRGVTLEFGAANIRISARDPEACGEAEENLPVEFAGPEISLGMNATYLLEALEPLETETVVMEFKDAVSPALIHPEKSLDTLAVIMPLRL